MNINHSRLRNLVVAAVIGAVPAGLVVAAASQEAHPSTELQGVAADAVAFSAGVAAGISSIRVGTKTYRYMQKNHAGRTIE